MRADRECYTCCVDKARTLLGQYDVPEHDAAKVLSHIKGKLETAGADTSAPILMAQAMRMLEEQTGITDAFDVPKKRYNKLLLGMEDSIYDEIMREKDRFLAALQYAITGNYIDFGAMSDVEEEKLYELLSDRAEVKPDCEEATRLEAELSGASRLVYITDNAGEIVLDKVFLRVIKELYPKLQITVIVRGKPVLNDATAEDAKLVGIDTIAAIIPNGTDIPGTPIDGISRAAREAIEAADLCIAKGQGNFETLRGCGKNIYYLFLCKCELFVRKFQVERFTPVLSNEKRIVQYA
ncbi:hypothetical protein CE91St62_08430 [Lachnospiraceae bacterium]|uniref:damage-control phosphatase ARMT1 family protein n=1 Tax=Extibacter sp. GGCC_0201 TaxID=2731209 RepID=UPI001AA16486|nr:ARMT1-like domain-containing protein [Extibacter sp. GGCC_0201]MBO1722355.1 DUF89 family protein [Extibacter sp. GGCC_0201]BDF32777.1 hypothetical protein CE91St61_08520 [Lachnospiraceae bacterium]BDF36782.1 hypothetical protein CE91St62_08430 [Lachnospiraceae bacterium]